MLALINMKKIYKVSFLSSFFGLFPFGYVMHEFALLPFLLLVFRFSSWFLASVWLFYIYGRG